MKKFIRQLIVFIAVPIFFTNIFTWFYEKPQRETFQKGNGVKLTKWNSIKDRLNEYDVIILGSSRGYSAYNPSIIDSVTQMNSYNMCTGSQHIIESFYMFNEILKYQKPKYLVYEIFIPSFRKNPDLFHVFSNAKYMSNDMIMNEFLADKFFDILFPAYKYKSYLKEDLKNPFAKKGFEKEADDNWIDGYKPSNQTNDSISIRNFESIYSFSKINTISRDKMESYIKSLKNLCDENGVELLCLRAPYPPTRLKKSITDDGHHYFSEFLEDLEVPFYDLNYRSLNNYTDYDFEDKHHLNSSGAKKASIDLARIMSTGNLIKGFK